nr:MAG TPA: hypothetical protein [Caudoviricetes sp.]
MSKFYSGPRSIKGYLDEIERYYNSMKSAIDFDHYAYHLSFLKQQIEFLSQYIHEEKKFDEFEEEVYLTGIDTEMIIAIIKTVESNLLFIRKGLAYTKFKQGEANE